jgi:hypothetical protein
LARLRKKATLYARELDMQGEPVRTGIENGKAESEADEQRTAVKGVFRVDVDTVEQLYENYIIPLTKEVEVSRLRVSPNLSSLKLPISGGIPTATAKRPPRRGDRSVAIPVMLRNVEIDSPPLSSFCVLVAPSV